MFLKMLVILMLICSPLFAASELDPVDLGETVELKTVRVQDPDMLAIRDQYMADINSASQMTVPSENQPINLGLSAEAISEKKQWLSEHQNIPLVDKQIPFVQTAHCMRCNKRFCTCPQRQTDKSWKETPIIETKEFKDAVEAIIRGE
jgi:hypothetical protein